MKDIWQRILDLERRNLRIGQVLTSFEETIKQAETAKTLLSATPRIVITGTEPIQAPTYVDIVRFKLNWMTFQGCPGPLSTNPSYYNAPVADTGGMPCAGAHLTYPGGDFPWPFVASEEAHLFTEKTCSRVGGPQSSGYLFEQQLSGGVTVKCSVDSAGSHVISITKIDPLTGDQYYIRSIATDTTGSRPLNIFRTGTSGTYTPPAYLVHTQKQYSGSYYSGGGGACSVTVSW